MSCLLRGGGGFLLESCLNAIKDLVDDTYNCDSSVVGSLVYDFPFVVNSVKNATFDAVGNRSCFSYSVDNFGDEGNQSEPH